MHLSVSRLATAAGVVAVVLTAGVTTAGACGFIIPTTTTSMSSTTVTTKKPASPAVAGAASVKSAAEWAKAYDSVWSTSDKNQYRKMSTSNDSWQFYNLAYEIDADVSMFEATGQTKYLDEALLLTNNTIKSAKVSSSIKTSQYKDSYLGWGSFSHPDGQDGGKEYPLYESYMWRYVTNMLVAMHADAPVMANANYKSQYDKILAFSEKNMFDKWASRGPDTIYRDYTHMSSHWAMIAFDLYTLTSNAKYKTVYTKFDTDLHKQLVKQSNGGYWWDWEWGKKNKPGSDVSHGNAVMAYVVHANQYGDTAWSAADMKAFVITFNKTVWPSAHAYAGFVDGSGSDNGWFNDGWVDLGRFDASLEKRLETHDVGQGTQFFASLALNAHLMGRDK